ncbi:MAG TPA: SURF1 family protein [Gemmatimonadales bacterium]
MKRSRLLLIAGFVLVAAVCARLGVWQVSRLRERRGANALAAAARSEPPVVLDGRNRGAAVAERRVRARGHYDHAHDIVVRGREYGGVPGVEIVSPLRLADGKTAVLVNRGFVPAPDAVTVSSDSLREPGEKQVEGIALPIASGGGRPLERGGRTTWARLDLEALQARLPYPIYPVYIRQSPDSALPRFPRRLDPPVLDDGPHLSYAIQWFAFAVIAVVFAGVIARQKREQ